jgi:hypothetical protein
MALPLATGGLKCQDGRFFRGRAGFAYLYDISAAWGNLQLCMRRDTHYPAFAWLH